MAYSLETSKRKFHRLLESMSDYGSTESLTGGDARTGSTTTVLSPSEKRRKLGASPSNTMVPSAAKIAAARLESSNSTPSTRKIKSPRTNLRSIRKAFDSMASSSRPSWNPHSRDDFLQRLGTFRKAPRAWAEKPESISEVAQAKHGWGLIGLEQVGCVTCAAHVNVPYSIEATVMTDQILESSHEQMVRDTKIKRLEERCAKMLIEGHYEGCLWKDHGCKGTVACGCDAQHADNSSTDQIYAIPTLQPNVMLQHLFENVNRLSKIERELPSSVKGPQDIGEEQQQKAAKLLYDHMANTTQVHNMITLPAYRAIFEKIYTLAVLGWVLDAEDIVSCSHCFRQVGLWQYRQRTMPDGQIRAPTYESFDGVDEHKPYCPMINARTQNPAAGAEEEKMAGWQLVASLVRRRAEGLGHSSGEAGETVGAGTSEHGRLTRVKTLLRGFSMRKPKKE